MKSRLFLLLTVLAVMLGSISAVAQETEDDETPPDANTGFVATLSDESLEDGVDDGAAETLYIRYHVCSLNPGADETCDETLDDEDFDAAGFDEWSEIAVEPNDAGEFNHGSFVSAFAREFDGGPGKGCILRFIAQSDWGKEEVDLVSGDLLIQAQTFCAFNKTTGEGVEGEEDEGKGKPDWAGKGKPPWAGGDDEVESAAADAGGPPPWAGKPGGPKNADN